MEIGANNTSNHCMVVWFPWWYGCILSEVLLYTMKQIKSTYHGLSIHIWYIIKCVNIIGAVLKPKQNRCFLQTATLLGIFVSEHWISGLEPYYTHEINAVYFTLKSYHILSGIFWVIKHIFGSIQSLYFNNNPMVMI